ncbi:MAG: DUF401 family protein [Thermoanaerobacteraceae bacterium]|nr:DUF401 family protein [Thermoanaerobacteraceae bacterium]
MLAVIGVIAAFLVAILVLNRWHNFGMAMLVSSLIVAFTGGFSFAETVAVFWQNVASEATLQLLLVVVLINMLGYILKQTEVLEAIVKMMLIVLKDVRLLVAVIPAVIGLLPVPGGAIMSAPLVAETGKKAGLSPERQAVANILYRHLLYLVFPLYPTLILAQDLSGFSVNAFVKQQVLPMVVGLVASILVLFRSKDVRETKEEQTEKWSSALGKLLYYASPIILVLVLALILRVHFAIAVGLGIVLALLLDVKSTREFVSRVKNYILPGLDWSLVAAVLGIMVFRGYVEASGAMNILAQRLDQLGIPVLVLAVVIPMLTGVATGASLAGVGILFPIFIPLIPPEMDKLAFLSLVFVSTLVGYIASPVHMCLVLTREACEARFGGLYLYLVLPLAAILLTSLILVVV